MVAIPLIVALLALLGLGLTVRFGQPPLPPERQTRLRRKRVVLAGVAAAGIVSFVVLVAVTGGSRGNHDCVGVAVRDATCR